MAKTNAERQREYRERRKKAGRCIYPGCPNQVPEVNALCDEHREQARETRRGRVRHLQAELAALRLEHAELRGRYNELEARYTEASEHGRLQAKYAELQKMYMALAGHVLRLQQAGLLDKSQLPADLAEFAA